MLALALCLLLQTPKPYYPGAAVYEAVKENRYLAALHAAEVEAANDKEGFMKDLLGLTQSYLSLERETLATFDSMGQGESEPIESSPIDDATALEAIAAIVEAAKDRRIVILNESHHMPRHRAFSARLIRELRKLGFDTFAAETFFEVEQTRERGWPNHDTGYYSQDPVFGELVREAIELGFQLVPYETTRHLPPDTDARIRINTREIDQATNLMQRVFEVNPQAKLYVHVGYSHATENWRDEGGKNELAWMAARLAKLSGFDPLTIDQTIATPHSEPKFEDPHWRRAVEKDRVTGPTVFRASDGSYVVVGNYAKCVDMQVFHPPVSEIEGRPDWLAHGRVKLSVPAELLDKAPKDAEFLLQAFFSGEDTSSAIPADQFVVAVGTTASPFYLRPGRYTLMAQDATGSVLGKLEEVAVK